jgi:hypothetical protein
LNLLKRWYLGHIDQVAQLNFIPTNAERAVLADAKVAKRMGGAASSKGEQHEGNQTNDQEA